MVNGRMQVSTGFLFALTICCLCISAVAQADHIIEGGRTFDHVMLTSYQKSIWDGESGLVCDSHPKFAKVAPGGYISFDIGHRKHFTTSAGPDLTVRTAGGVQYTVAVARIGRASDMNLATSVVESSSKTELEVEIAESLDLQYVRILNGGDDVLFVDCVWAHHVIDHPLLGHDHHPD